MADPQLFRLRVFFVKAGRCALLSHLEVARALERAVRRAKLPYAISQGFSPHMKISFGAALPVGVGGTQECFDLHTTHYVAPDAVCAALQAASVPDLMVQSCAYIAAKDPAASAAFPVGVYEALLSAPLTTLAVPTHISVMRKKKEKQLIVADYLVEEVQQEAVQEEVPQSEEAYATTDGARLTFALVSRPTGSLRADILMAEILKANPHVVLKTLTRTAQLPETL
ncbi:MAG: TIGR03936 family radical SAM-associated protein [Eggerthellaceae bacterium]